MILEVISHLINPLAQGQLWQLMASWSTLVLPDKHSSLIFQGLKIGSSTQKSDFE